MKNVVSNRPTNHGRQGSTGGNRRLAQWRVKWLIEHSTSHQLLWCIDSFELRNPPLRQAPNRYVQPLSNISLTNQLDKTMQNPTTLTITDDSGFLGIVNSDKYNSFVSEDWELPELFKRFVDEMNNDNLILWSTGSENVWTVSFVNKPSDTKSFREFYKTLEVTNGKIFLTNYEDLTMAALSCPKIG